MKTKILVCGSTGFLMANFIRYILYRSKDFDVTSIDNLKLIKDTKRIYFNKNHRFYVGDVSDKYFVERIIALEKPDIIVCGDEIYEYEMLLKTTLNLISFKIPIIMLLPIAPDNDPDKMGSVIKSILTSQGHTAIEMPNRFGMRQRPLLMAVGGNIAWLLRSYLYDKAVSVSNDPLPWVYGEDVASFIWYIIENRQAGVVKMPPLGFASEKYITDKIESLYQKDYLISNDICKEHNDGLIVNYEWSKVDWKPDSKDLDSVLEKTIRWFDANRWALDE